MADNHPSINTTAKALEHAPHLVAARCVENDCCDVHGCEVRGHCQTYELLKDLGIYDGI